MYDLDNRIDLMRLHSDYRKLCGSDGRGRAALIELFNREKIRGGTRLGCSRKKK